MYKRKERATAAGKSHNAVNVALHIEQGPSHVGNDILGPFFDIFRCRLHIGTDVKTVAFTCRSCRLHIGTDVKMVTFTCRSCRFSCRFMSVLMDDRISLHVSRGLTDT